MNKTTWNAVGVGSWSSSTQVESRSFSLSMTTDNEYLYRAILDLLIKQRKKEDDFKRGETNGL